MQNGWYVFPLCFCFSFSVYNTSNLLECLLSLLSIFLLPKIHIKMAYPSSVFPRNSHPQEREKVSFFSFIHPPPSLISFIILCFVTVDRESVLFFFPPLHVFLQVFHFLFSYLFLHICCFCTGKFAKGITSYCCSMDFPGRFDILRVDLHHAVIYWIPLKLSEVHMIYIFKTFCILAKIISSFFPQTHRVLAHFCFSNSAILSAGLDLFRTQNPEHGSRLSRYLCISSRSAVSTLYT